MDEQTPLIRITQEAKQALDLLAASKRTSKVAAASDAILVAWQIELKRLSTRVTEVKEE